MQQPVGILKARMETLMSSYRSERSRENKSMVTGLDLVSGFITLPSFVYFKTGLETSLDVGILISTVYLSCFLLFRIHMHA